MKLKEPKKAAEKLKIFLGKKKTRSKTVDPAPGSANDKPQSPPAGRGDQ